MLTPDVSVALKDIDIKPPLLFAENGSIFKSEILGPTKSAPELFVTVTALELLGVQLPLIPLTSTALNEPKE